MSVIVSAILLGISLCADCFAVALCSSVTVTREEVRKKVWTIAAVFAVIQTGLFMAGWGLGTVATELISEPSSRRAFSWPAGAWVRARRN